MNITTDHLVQAIRATDGKLFSLEYNKKDGTTTQMTCRLGVTSHLSGGAPKTNPDLITVFSFDRQAYRTLLKENIVSFKCGEVVMHK